MRLRRWHVFRRRSDGVNPERTMQGALARGGTRFFSLALMLVLIAGVAVLVSRGQAAQKPTEVKSLDPETKVLNTRDGGPLHITYYRSLRGKEAPVVVLLHQKDGNRFIWQGKDGFAETLQREGYAVITVDLRFHGESKVPGAAVAGNANQPDGKKGSKKVAGAPDLKPADYKLMVENDMEAVKKFIYDEHQAENLNMNRMGIVGPEMGASVATLFAANDWLKEPHEDGQPGFQTPRGQDVRALVLISPQTSFHGLVMAPAINVIRDPRYKIGMFFAVGKNDPQDKNQTKKLHDQAAALGGKGDRIFLSEYAGKLRGTDLIGKKLGLEKHIVSFFGETLTKIEAPWRDRQSKLDKAK
jgi:pimeloyl-ACP methyl ester carboxylesterase